MNISSSLRKVEARPWACLSASASAILERKEYWIVRGRAIVENNLTWDLKAFDSVEIEPVLEALDSQGVPTQYIKIFRELYKNFAAKVSPFYDDIYIDVKREEKEIETFTTKFDGENGPDVFAFFKRTMKEFERNEPELYLKMVGNLSPSVAKTFQNLIKVSMSANSMQNLKDRGRLNNPVDAVLLLRQSY
ncbi:unnamed protein product [Angiostrongylus costaricensis]|uniref:Uncharacterized protein n=1 Tax=Angiostrongylus costaricensis TaxID=334426 RepID=A0A0R3PX46_ANGCS|nr:unnamed protein product [Angiostrongylus costaricensis]